ncbi:MAG: hypothetical protein QT00_C0002G0346 [archaeon GW2011_AR5]|nr:MAG: hypothetical protein QT00_C0002G0346 [archaeon GW2011_AR5]
MKFDVMAIVMFLLRMGPAILFVFFMMLMFFSFKVDVRENTMERFVFELSDTVTSDTRLVADESVFSPEKLTAAEQAEIEQYAQNCDFGYQIDIEASTGPTVCGSDNDCSGFCGNVCGLTTLDMGITGNCNCNLEVFGADFCECKKTSDREWQDSYKWRLGYMPTSMFMSNPIVETSSKFPVGIEMSDTALPATMEITAYDAFLTRISCATAKAFHTKEKFVMKFATNQLPFGATAFRRSGTAGTHVCLYNGNDPLAGECRYLPNIPVEDLDILAGLLSSARNSKWQVTAYPLKTSSACPPDASAIAGRSDTVSTILLCMEDV